MRRTWCCVALVAVLAMPACTKNDCSDTETVMVNVTGDCGIATQVTFQVAECRIQIGDGEAESSGLPPSGTLNQAQSSFRRGGWIIYGPLPTPDAGALGAAPSTFKVCKARRVDWRLELDCWNGSGERVCGATLTED